MFSNIQRSLLFLSLLIITIIALIVSFRAASPKTKYTFDSTRSAVVKEMKELNRLETAEFSIEKVIDAGTTDENEIKQVLFGDRILLIAHGSVIAGFDLSKLKESDIQVEGKTLRVDLPPPQILTSRLDNDKTRVYDRRQGLLTKGDKDLEAKARTVAEKEIVSAACNTGILGKAEDNARKQLQVIFRSYGFEIISLNIPQGTC